MKKFTICDELNEMYFGVEVSDADYEKAKELCLEGLSRWYDTETYPEYECAGYAEPAMELMDAAGIKYKTFDNEEEDIFSGDFEMVEY